MAAFDILSCIHTTKNVDDDASSFAVGRATDVGTGVGDSALFNDEHADQDSGLDLLRNNDAAVRVGSHLATVLVPVHAVRRFRPPGGVAHQLDRTVRFHVFGPGHLDRCRTHARAYIHGGPKISKMISSNRVKEKQLFFLALSIINKLLLLFRNFV